MDLYALRSNRHVDYFSEKRTSVQVSATCRCNILDQFI